MDVALEEVAGAFQERERRPAVFDREIREQVGEWWLPEPVPITEIIRQFTDHPSFADGDAVQIPVHEPDSAELTGEYLVYRPNEASILYYDFAADDLQHVPLTELNSAYPTWQVRFWHPDYEPPEPPTYHTNGEGEAPEHAPDGLADPSTETAQPATEPDHLEARTDLLPSESFELSMEENGNDGSTNEPVTAEGTRTEGRGDERIESMRSMITEQKLAERETARRQWEGLPPAEFVAKRGGIQGLGSTGVDTDTYGRQLVRLAASDDDAAESEASLDDLAAGSEVLLDTTSDVEGFPAEATLVEREGDELALSIYWDRGPANPSLSAFEPDAGNEFVLGTLLDPDPYERRQTALETIADDDRKRGWLTGTATVEFADELTESPSTARLDRSQYAAASAALRTSDVFCIRGPPGTGTTRTLIEIIRAACADGERVLAVSHSPAAIDRLLAGESTSEHTDPDSLHHVLANSDMTAARIGEPSDSAVADTYVGNDRYQSDVVCATMDAADQFGADTFDLVVADEATRASLPETLVPVSRGERAVLAGDPMQLPPTPAGEFSDGETVRPTLFERLCEDYGDGIVASLRTQYRMHEAIAAFPNRQFYDGMLTHGQRNRTWTIPSLAPLAAIHVAGTEQQSPSESYYNEAEVAVVRDEVAGLLEAGVAPGDIGVIAPYSAQIGKIRVGLEMLDVADTDRIQVGTTDSFQGTSKEAIVVSFTRSNPQGFSDFLTYPNEGPRRLNVAMTRARRRCLLLGNFDTLKRRDPTRDPAESSADTYGLLYEHLVEQDCLTSRDREGAPAKW